MEKLNFKETFFGGIGLGLANIWNLLLMGIVYIITIWIPYLNVATTIGVYKQIIGLSKGEGVKPLDIFDGENFKNLSDFFLLLGLQTAGIGAATAFLFFPGLVLSIAWEFAVYFLIDKGTSPLKSLRLSFDATRGEKWSIFWLILVFCILVVVVCGVVSGLLALFCPEWLVAIVSVIISLACIPVAFGLEAKMLAHFSAKADALIAE